MARDICTRASAIHTRKLRYLPVRPKTAPARSKYVEPRLLQALKESISEWEMRGQCSDDVVKQIIKLFDRKQNNIKFDLVSRDDPQRVVHARNCPDIQWSDSTVLGNSGDSSYRSNIILLLCPVAIKVPDQQVITTQVRGQYLVRDTQQKTIDSSILLKQLACLIKLALPGVMVLKCDTYIEVVGVNGYTLHFCPVVAKPTYNRADSVVPATMTTPHIFLFSFNNKLEGSWLMSSGKTTWTPFNQTSHIIDSSTLNYTIILLSELRRLHSLRLTLDDAVALVTAAVEEHAQETGYTGVIPLHHTFSLSLRLLLHTLQSSRIVRHPKTKDIAMRKLAFGRSHKYDVHVRNLIKVCLMFLKMEQREEFTGLFPPPAKLYTLNVPGEETDEDLMSEEDTIDLDDL